MLQSMTGFGQANFQNENLEIQIEIKSVNSKYADIHLRTGSFFNAKEIEIRKQIQERLKRGKITLSLRLKQLKHDEDSLTVDTQLAKKLFAELKSLADELELQPDLALLQTVLQQNEIIKIQSPDEAIEKTWPFVKDCIHKAIENCVEFRKTEGKDLKIALSSYVNEIQQQLEQVKKDDQSRLDNIRKRLTQLFQELSQQSEIDKYRLEQEMLYYADKLDITEEKVRLQSHINHFLKTLEKEEVGKKINFIAQEMGREINTIGSKANDASVQRSVVSMKEALDKIKEQALNVL